MWTGDDKSIRRNQVRVCPRPIAAYMGSGTYPRIVVLVEGMYGPELCLLGFEGRLIAI